jgi:hypothetical protein
MTAVSGLARATGRFPNITCRGASFLWAARRPGSAQARANGENLGQASPGRTGSVARALVPNRARSRPIPRAPHARPGPLSPTASGATMGAVLDSTGASPVCSRPITPVTHNLRCVMKSAWRCHSRRAESWRSEGGGRAISIIYYPLIIWIVLRGEMPPRSRTSFITSSIALNASVLPSKDIDTIDMSGPLTSN